QYVYLKESYNKLIAFLYGWSFFAVIQTGTIAAVGVAFSKFTAYLMPAVSEDNIIWSLKYGTDAAGADKLFNINAAQLVSIVVILLLTYINTKGVKNGKIIQTTFTLTKLLSIFGLIAFGFIAFKGDIWTANWTNAWDMHALAKDGTTTSYTIDMALGALAIAMVGTIFSSDAWNNVTFIAGEMKNPKRDVGLSLFFGTLIVTIIYVSANLMYTAVLPLQDIAMVKFFPPGATIVTGSTAGAIAVYTKQPEDVVSRKTSAYDGTFTYQGYSAVHPFNPHIPSGYQRLLLWEPRLFLDRTTNQYQLRFQNPGNFKKLLLRVKGFTSDGRLMDIEQQIDGNTLH
ncbi:MAG: amino acid permease, partial [Sphingobacteriales bacterium]